MKKYTVDDWHKDNDLRVEIGQEIDEEIYRNMLEILPPINLPSNTPICTKLGIVAGFRVGEPYIHEQSPAHGTFNAFYAAFGKSGSGKYYFLGNQNKYGEIYDERKRRVVSNYIATHCIGLKDYIVEWCKKNKYLDDFETLYGKDAYDVGYDLKFDISQSEYNPISKAENEDQIEERAEEYDEWYDVFLEDDILPILTELGATIDDKEE